MIRSLESNIRAFVNFKNTSKRRIEVHWINFQGSNVHYTNLEANESCSINTFVTHPWIFLCPLTGERLCIRNSEIFYPQAWFKFINKTESGLSVERQVANIHYPLKSLREIAIWRVLFLVNSKNDIRNLDLPKTLKNDLFYYFHLSTRYREDSEDLSE